MTPKILIFHTGRMANAARLALTFQQVNCLVYAICLRDHPLVRLSAVEQVFPYRPRCALRSLRVAIIAAEPTLIIPCDDRAVRQLLRLYRGLGDDPIAVRVREVIERSLANPDAFERIVVRSNLLREVSEARAPLPCSRLVGSLAELRDRLPEIGLPAVLKLDYSTGGAGVAIVSTAEDAERAFCRMSRYRALLRGLKRVVWDGDPDLFWRGLRRTEPMLTLQAFVNGCSANIAVACWRGEVIASICAEVVAVRAPLGNASVIRIIEHRGMLDAAKRIVHHLGITGFCGIDFILEAGSGRPFIIEVNPRATQINHLALGPGRDLAAALRARAAGEPIEERPPVTDRDLIALFPHEWHRDPESGFFATAYQDIPRDVPELVRAFIDVVPCSFR
jgi:hypothetical protein